MLRGCPGILPSSHRGGGSGLPAEGGYERQKPGQCASQPGGDHERRTEKLELTVEAYRAALEVFGAAGEDDYIEEMRQNLLKAQKLLAERKGNGKAAE